jgi:hypothetical protein
MVSGVKRCLCPIEAQIAGINFGQFITGTQNPQGKSGTRRYDQQVQDIGLCWSKNASVAWISGQ